MEWGVGGAQSVKEGFNLQASAWTGWDRANTALLSLPATWRGGRFGELTISEGDSGGGVSC
jgi:hypothetical protein